MKIPKLEDRVTHPKSVWVGTIKDFKSKDGLQCAVVIFDNGWQAILPISEIELNK